MRTLIGSLIATAALVGSCSDKSTKKPGMNGSNNKGLELYDVSPPEENIPASPEPLPIDPDDCARETDNTFRQCIESADRAILAEYVNCDRYPDASEDAYVCRRAAQAYHRGAVDRCNVAKCYAERTRCRPRGTDDPRHECQTDATCEVLRCTERALPIQSEVEQCDIRFRTVVALCPERIEPTPEPLAP